MKKVYIATSAGAGGQGGIAKMVSYTVDAFKNLPAAPPLEVLETRGGGGKIQAAVTFIQALARLQQACRRGDVGLLHLHLASRGSTYRKLLLYGIAAKSGVPVIVHLHGGGFKEFYAGAPDKMKARIRTMFQGAAKVLVLGKSWQSFAQEQLGVEKQNIELFPNAVPDPNMTPRFAQEKSGPVRLLFVGHLLERKGVDDLIQALAGTRLKQLDWRMTLAGSGDIKAYEAKIAEAGLPDKVTCAGWLSGADLQQAYHKADILVLPSHVENQPLCVLEAMAHGLAVVATRVGTLPDMIADGKNGMLVEPRNPEQLSKTMSDLILSGTTVSYLGNAARQTYEKNYTLEGYASRLAGLYRAILS